WRAAARRRADRRPFQTGSRRRSSRRQRVRSSGRNRPGGNATASGPKMAASSRSSLRPTCQGKHSSFFVLIVAAPPEARFVAPLGCAIEPLIHAPEAVHSARIGGIGVVHDAVVERERADARGLAQL